MSFPHATASLPRALLLFVLAAILGGCMFNSQRYNATSKSSAVEFLYPAQDRPMPATGIPELHLPLRVGIAFVPAETSGRNAPTEMDQHALLERVAANFRQLPFVKDIEVIPSPYLRPRGGFANLDQIRTMYGVDVIALVSFDQVQFTDTGLLSLSYWTIVGEYLVKGEKNDTQTMLDTVVFDIPSRKLLFRAPGSSEVKGRATPVNASEQLRADSRAGFDAAGARMVDNLQQQLTLFQDRMREHPDEVRVVRSAEYERRAGAGALDAAWLALLAMAGLGLALRSRA